LIKNNILLGVIKVLGARSLIPIFETWKICEQL
jgi:hypothetical protein